MSADPTQQPTTANGDLVTGSEVRLADGRLMPAKDAPVGGQAVLEGVMMRGVSTWAVAVRAPAPDAAGQNGSANGHHEHPLVEEAELGAEAAATTLAGVGPAAGNGALGDAGEVLGPIEIHTESFEPLMKRRRLYRVPVVRGVIALYESLKIGMKALGISANAQLEEPDEEISGKTWGFTIFLSLAFAIGLFFVLPVTVASFWKDELGSSVLFVVVEKLIRIAIFLGYLWAISHINDLRRVFEYHGAEHKVISCYEAGEPLTPENADKYSRLHVRCGTSFLLIVMIIAVFVFAPIGRPDLHWLILSRIVGIGLVAGLAYEVIRWAGRNRRKRWVRGLMWPGLQLQKLTTRPPSLDQLAVSIAALEAVLAVEDPSKSSEEDRLGMEVVA
ncbi:MAG TPA: DUF1385 domain-containing protein [Solirubrobacterales bacterium]|nr:DUF1385 domain-containing protein [Solirubrobacterales bacterium]